MDCKLIKKDLWNNNSKNDENKEDFKYQIPVP
jgi:hypothetical protein